VVPAVVAVEVDADELEELELELEELEVDELELDELEVDEPEKLELKRLELTTLGPALGSMAFNPRTICSAASASCFEISPSHTSAVQSGDKISSVVRMSGTAK
jgi:hypothetical protein